MGRDKHGDIDRWIEEKERKQIERKFFKTEHINKRNKEEIEETVKRRKSIFIKAIERKKRRKEALK